MKYALSVAILIAFSWVLQPAVVVAEQGIGFVQNVSGQAHIFRNSEKIDAEKGAQLHAGDTISTGPDGSIGIVFQDQSSASMGPNSNFVVRNFEFSPNEGKAGFLINITKGSFSYMSGLIAKLSPESAKFETPTATIGIRGTHFAINVEKP